MDSLSVGIGQQVQTANDIFQILFYITIAMISILSYLQAKKTLFTPIKTETFKLQLKNLQEILAFFQHKSDNDFTIKFDLEQIFKKNSMILLDSYVEKFFSDEINISEEVKKKRYENLVGGLVSQEFAEQHFEKVDYESTINKKTPVENKPKNPAIILSKWQKFNYGFVRVTQKYYDEIDKIHHLASSPLIPTELRNLLLEFESKLTNNVSIIGETLTEIAKDLPEKYPTPESLNDVDLAWMWNEYNQKKKNLEEQAKKIMQFINDYLKIEDLKNMS